MPTALEERLLAEIDAIPLIDPHTHINPHAPAARNLADILGYHYYTELAHSAGMPREQIEAPGLPARERVARLLPYLEPLENTIQYSWLIEFAQKLIGWPHDRLTPANWETLYDACESRMSQPGWPEQVLARSKLQAVFLTNDFDDPLEGFDTCRYVPCLRTDELVFHLSRPAVRERLERASSETIDSVAGLRRAIGRLFERFCSRGARACAISLPPDFRPVRIEPQEAERALRQVCGCGTAAATQTGESSVQQASQVLAYFVFWTLAEYCAEFRLPFDLMIGVNRGVYAGGVYQGQDLYDSRVSLLQYRELFNAFPQVVFPISVLASVTNQELASYAWIFPNVVAHGHWWYSNTPSIIEHDAAHRLEAVPQTKQIAYYSDMYKLEFALPKFAMYKRVLARILAERYVIGRGWTEERALALARRVLRDNVERVFYGTEPRE